MAAYVYRPLDHSTRTIRILRLLSSPNLTDQVHCEIVETVLGDIPYEAVTYTWGSPDKPRTILVNGLELKVTESAYAALQQLRLPDQERLLWIDAICIDQDDPKEKNHQVAQMRRVYEKAEMVLIWLGPNNDCIDEFFEMMEDPRLERLKTLGSKGVRFIPDETLRAAVQAGFLELVARPWFRRVWIIQEIASAQAATIVCGPWRMSSKVFPLLPAVFGFSVPSRSQSVLDIMPGHARRESWWREQPDLYTLLAKFGDCEATDARDKVFALMGVASDGGITETFVPDYEKTPDEVAQATTSFILFHEVLQLSDYGFPAFTLDELLDKVDYVFEWALDWAVRTKCKDIILRLLGATPGPTKAYIQKKGLLCYFAGRDSREIGRSGLLGLWQDQQAIEVTIELGEVREERDSVDALFAWALSLDSMVDVNVCDEAGQTPLHKAILGKHVKRLDQLLRHKSIALDRPNHAGLSPLSQAVMLERKEMVKILLGYNVDINHRTGGPTPIAMAIREGSAEMVKLLLTRHDVKLNHGGFRPLLEVVRCVQSRQLSEQEAKMEKEAKLDHILSYPHLDVHEQKDGNAALMLAIQHGERNIIALLRTHGVINNFYIRHSRRVFQRAILEHDLCAARTILEAEQDLTNELFAWKGVFSRVATSTRATQKNVSTALWYSVYTKDEEMIKLLVQRGSNVETKDTQWNMSPLAVSCMHGQLGMAKLLLDHGASLNSEDWARSATMEWAAISGQISLVIFLIEVGQQRGQGLPLGRSLLKAVGLRQFEMVGILLDNAAPLEHRDRFGRTPLAMSASICDMRMVGLLLARGADIGAEDCNRLTPSWWVAHHRMCSIGGEAVYHLPDPRQIQLAREKLKSNPNVMII